MHLVSKKAQAARVLAGVFHSARRKHSHREQLQIQPRRFTALAQGSGWRTHLLDRRRRHVFSHALVASD